MTSPSDPSRNNSPQIHLERLKGQVPPAVFAVLQAAAADGRSMLIAGPQSAGATTMIRALC